MDKEAVRIFTIAAKDAFGGDGLRSVGEEPITPKESLLLTYSATPPRWESLGFDNDGQRIPGFLSTSSFISLLSILPDGLRPGEFMIKTVFPKNSDEGKILMISNVVFDTRRFGAHSLLSFVQSFPNIPLAVFFTEIIWDSKAEMYLKTFTGKNKKKQIAVYTHTHVLVKYYVSTTVCTLCNTIWML